MKKKEVEEELFVPKEKHLGKIIAILILLIILCGGVYFYYKKIFTNPKLLVTKSIEKISLKIDEISQMINTDSPFELNGLINIKLETDDKEYDDIINNLNIQLNSQIDEKNDIYNVNLNTKYKEEKLINIKLYNDKDNHYVLLENIINNEFLQTNENYLPTNYKKKAITNVLKVFLNTLQEELNNYDLRRSKEKIDNQELHNNYLKLDNDGANKFVSNLLNNLKKNQTFINSFKEINNDIEKEIDNLLNEKTKNIKLSFYTENTLNQKLVKVKIEKDDDEFVISFLDDNNYLLELKNKEKEEVIKLTISDKKVNVNIDIKNDEKKIIDAKFNYENIKNIEKINLDDIQELTEEKKEEIETKIKEDEKLDILYQKIVKEKTE